jgi:hypothetical protein
MTLPENFRYMRPRDQEHYKNREFELWWYANKDRIEKRCQHSFSGMVRLSQSPNYYHFYWEYFIFNRNWSIPVPFST